MDIANLLNHVQGTLGTEGCALLKQYAQTVPPDSLIVDLNCGSGRSSISLASGLQHESISIVSWDPHLTSGEDLDAKDGTFASFIRNLRLFNVHHRIIPVVHAIRSVPTILPSQSAHLVVAQVDRRMSFSDSMDAISLIAQKLVHPEGTIILFCASDADRVLFGEMSDALFANGYSRKDVLMGAVFSPASTEEEKQEEIAPDVVVEELQPEPAIQPQSEPEPAIQPQSEPKPEEHVDTSEVAAPTKRETTLDKEDDVDLFTEPAPRPRGRPKRQ